MTPLPTAHADCLTPNPRSKNLGYAYVCEIYGGVVLLSSWAPAGMGKGGALAPWKCRKVFCALVVAVKRSVDQLFIIYLNFWRVGVIHLVVLACVLRTMTKKVFF